MLDVEPKSLVFRDIRLNESYTSNLVLSNSLSTHVSVTLRPSAPGRYIVAPNQVTIQPGQSVVVTVRLHINNFPAYEKGVRGQEDHIQVSSSFFEQKINVTFFLQKRSFSVSTGPSGSASPTLSFQNKSTVVQDTTMTSNFSQSPTPDSHKHRKFVKTMQNNTSIAAAAAAEKRSTDHIISELNSAIKFRDMTIEKLKSTVVKLEQNHPNFHEIIQDRVEIERISFEEKSQKIIEILQKKDLKIENLQQQLDDQLKREQSLEDELEKQQEKYSKLFEQDILKQKQGGNRYIEELQHRLSAVEDENSKLRSSLESVEQDLKAEKLKKMKDTNRGDDAGNVGGDSPIKGHVKVLKDRLSSQEKELVSLREQTVDQVEQIEVLISEVSKLRSEAEENRERYEQQQQLVNNMSAIQDKEAEAQTRIQELHNHVLSLEEELKESNERYTDIYNYNKMLELQLEDSAREMEQSANIPQALDTTGMKENNLLMLYKERACKAEEELNQLRHIYEEAQDTERQNAPLISDLEERGKRLVAEEFAFQNKLENLRSQEIRLNEKEATLRHIMSTSLLDEFSMENICRALKGGGGGGQKENHPQKPKVPELGKKPVNETFDTPILDDANAWWSYVWHEMKKFNQNRNIVDGSKSKKRVDESFEDIDSSAHLSDNGDQLGIWSDITLEELHIESVSGGKEEEKVVDDQAVTKRNLSKRFLQRKNSQIEKLRSIVRSHAIEITTLRQAKLLTGMKNKQEMTLLEEKLDSAKREISKLQAYNRNHHGDKELRITEMTSTIKSLSGRSDMHSALACAHQDLEAEKLVVCSLRNDIESYRELLENEKEKVAVARRDLDKAQTALGASQVAETLLSVSGISPSALIELFSGRLMWLQGELMKARSAASSMSLMKQVNGCSNSPTTPSLKAHLSPLSPTSSSALNSTSADTKDTKNNSPPNFSDQVSFREPEHWQKELMRKATSPDKLLSGLDTVLLTRKFNEQSETIETLLKKINELENALTSATIRDNMIGISHCIESEGDKHLDRFGEQARIEKNAALRRLELCQENLKQAENEVEVLRGRVVYAESALSDFKKNIADETVKHSKPCISCGKRIESGVENRSNHKETADSEQSDAEDESLLVLMDMRSNMKDGGEEENCLNCTKLQHILQERTTQLKVMMETLEALQLGEAKHVNVDSENSTVPAETSSLENIMTNLDAASFSRDDAKLEQLLNAGYNTRPNNTKKLSERTGGQWETRALIKRIVELTANSTAHCSALAMSERQVKQLEVEKVNFMKEMNRMRKKIHQMENSMVSCQNKYSSALINLNRLEKVRAKETSDLQAQLDAVTKVIRERENECDELRVSYQEIKQQMDLADRSAFCKWFDDVVLSNCENNGEKKVNESVNSHHAATPSSENDKVSRKSDAGSDNSSVRNLVVTLLVQWREQAGFYPRGATGPISKAEQRFLQRITDVVMDSHDRASLAEKDAFRAREEYTVIDRRLRTVQKRLESAILQLFHYRCRAEAAERVGVASSRLKLRTEGTLASVMRKGNVKLSEDLISMTTQFLKEKALNTSLEVDLKYAQTSCKELKIRIAELEARGSVFIQAKDEALNTIDSKIREGEKQLQQWMKAEIPRLMTGLPISEDDFSGYDLNDALDVLGVEPMKHDNFYGSRWTEERNRDRLDAHHDGSTHKRYALIQALCTSKATQNKLETTVHTLNEKNSALRVRIMELSGVVNRWKEDLYTCAEKERGDGLSESKDDTFQHGGARRAVEEAHENEIALRNLTEQQRHKIVELQESLIFAQGQIAHVEERESGLRELLEVLRRGETDLKQRAAIQLSRVKQETEERHVLELRSMREAYEQEKILLMKELEDVSAALASARVKSAFVNPPVDSPPNQVGNHSSVDHAYRQADQSSGNTIDSTCGPVSSASDTSSPNQHSLVHTPKKVNDFSISPLSKSTPDSPSSDDISHQKRRVDDTSSDNYDMERNLHNYSHEQQLSKDSLDSRYEVSASKSSSKQSPPENVVVVEGDIADDKFLTSSGRSRREKEGFTKTDLNDASPPTRGVVLSTPLSPPSDQDIEDLSYAVDDLKKRLAVEKERSRQARDQVMELEQLLETQRETFQRHLELEKDIAQNMNPNVTMSTSESSTTPVQMKNHESLSFSSQDSQVSTPFANLTPDLKGREQHQYSTNSFTDTIPFPSQKAQQELGSQSSSSSPASLGDRLTNQHLSPTDDRVKDSSNLQTASRAQTSPIIKEVAAEDPELWPPMTTMSNQLQTVLQDALDHVNSASTETHDHHESNTYIHGALHKNRLLSLLHESFVISERLLRASQNPEVEDKYMKVYYNKEKQNEVDTGVQSDIQSTGKFAASGVGKELSGLVQRVNLLEDIFNDEGSTGEHVPDKHLYLLRELRGRVVFLEEAMQSEITRRQSEWNLEKEKLLRELEDARQEASTMSELSSDGVEMIKKRYEHALQDAQDALVEQASSFTKQIELLEVELERAKTRDASMTMNNSSSSSNNTLVGDMETHLHMQKLLDAAASETDKYRKQLRDLEAKYDREVEHMRSQFDKYRRAQEQIVTSLEQQVVHAERQGRIDRALHSGAEGHKAGGSDVFSVGGDSEVSLTEIFGHDSVSPVEAEAILREIGYRVRVKQSELKAVLRALSLAGAATSSEEQKVMTENRIKTPNEDLLEARVEAAGMEVEQLYRLLERERKNNSNIQKVVTFSDNITEQQLTEDKKDPDTTISQSSIRDTTSRSKSTGKKNVSTSVLLSTRKAYAQEIDDLKSKKLQLEEAALSHKTEVSKLRHVISELKDQMQSLREDNSRKSKLLSAIRASKASDDNALEQWRHEVSESEEKLKRANRSLASKEAIVRDLRSKLEQLEAQLKSKSMQLAEVGAVEAIGETAKSWSFSELRHRYKASELEKSRMKTRINSLKEKVTELEKQVKSLESASSKRKALEDKTDAMKLALARKDALIKGLKEQLETVRVELLSLQEISASRKSDDSKHISTLQKQVDTAEERFKEALKDKEKLRNRYEEEVRKINEEIVYLRGLLSETTHELENRFHYDPPPDKGHRTVGEPQKSASDMGKDYDHIKEKSSGSHQDIRRSPSGLDSSFIKSKQHVAEKSGEVVPQSSGRIAVISELNDIMEELSGDTSGNFKGSTKDVKVESRRHVKHHSYRSKSAVLLSSSDESEENISRRGSQKARRSDSRSISIASRLLQESEANISDDSEGIQPRKGTLSHRGSGTSKKSSHVQERLLHSPESDDTGDSSLLSVEKKLKGLIHAALKEE